MAKLTIWERISKAFYSAKTLGGQVRILLRDETVEFLLKSSQVNFKRGDLVFENGNDKIAVGIDSSKLAGPHAYVRTFNGQDACSVPKICWTDIPTITI